MASRLWVGGATAVAQVDTITIANTWAAADTMTTTFTGEDGSTQTVNTVVASSTLQTNRDAHLADLQAVQTGGTLMDAVTFASSGTTAITATAKTAGIPFYCTSTETTAGDGTWTRAETTASDGPNDWETAANWLPAAIPANDDDLVFAGTSNSLLYGLRPGNGAGNQGGASISLKSLRIGETFTGRIGDSVNSYYLDVDVNSTTGGNTPRLVLNGRGFAVWIKGTCTNTYVIGTLPTPHAFKFSGTITTLYLLGSKVAGNVDIANSSAITTLFQLNCPSVTTTIGTSVSSLATVELNAGTLITNSSVQNTTIMNISGTGYWRHNGGDIEDVTMRGGHADIHGTGDIDDLLVYDGLFDLSHSEAIDGSTHQGITIQNATVYGGVVKEKNALANVTWSNNIIVHGGLVDVDSGTTVTAT